MSFKKLNDILVQHLTNINRTRQDVCNNTVFKNVLQDNDGMGGLSSSDLYRLLVQNSIKSNNQQLRSWPQDWLELTVWDLSEQIG
ncbi:MULTISPECIES: hypothetical protein [unclassified Aureispira]|uniref:hypothetical protein n=1 Tax=unclassified Aureispira TaxID=2649989 RepID=UPI000697A7DC|nr:MULTISPECIES: hypothetical protein [unclassified Aureispira]WMX16104.1 hypothetical protein QP953_06970 [Aureispira sp. CCB-E]